MICVLDACAMIAFLRGETGANDVSSFLKGRNVQCFSHAINLCEVYYAFFKAADQNAADSAINDLLKVGIVERRDFDDGFWKEAGGYKVGAYKRKEQIALADCIALSLTKRLNGQLVTSDHKEFDPIKKQNLCPIYFFR